MWLQRLGTEDQNIFFGFCAVVFVILVIIITIIVVRCCYRNPVPGQSMTFFVIFAALLVCLEVLFRGVQPSWGTHRAMQNVCQIFVPPMVLGYTLLASALLVRLWLLLLAFHWGKNTVEWLGHFVLWVLLIIAGAAVIVWEAAFRPNAHRAVFNTTGGESRLVYECRGWKFDGSRDNEQFGWSVASSCYFTLIFLVAVAALPFYACLSHVPRQAIPSIVSTLLTTVNAMFCVIAGLIVWFQYKPATVWKQDSNKYAIIGSLQLWMIFFALVATLISEVMTWRAVKSTTSQPHRAKGRTKSDVKSAAKSSPLPAFHNDNEYSIETKHHVDDSPTTFTAKKRSNKTRKRVDVDGSVDATHHDRSAESTDGSTVALFRDDRQETSALPSSSASTLTSPNRKPDVQTERSDDDRSVDGADDETDAAVVVGSTEELRSWSSDSDADSAASTFSNRNSEVRTMKDVHEADPRVQHREDYSQDVAVESIEELRRPLSTAISDYDVGSRASTISNRNLEFRNNDDVRVAVFSVGVTDETSAAGSTEQLHPWMIAMADYDIATTQM